MPERKAANDNTVIVALKRLDMLNISVREAVILFVVIERPGINAADIASALELKSRSLAQYVVERLEKWGLIEDRRKEVKRGVPSMFYATDKGRAIWEQIGGTGEPRETEEESHW